MKATNTLWTKLAALSLGAVMALGVGLTASRVESSEVKAATATLTITRSSFPSGALAYNVTDTWSATTSSGGLTISGEGDIYSTANQTTLQTKNSGVSTMYHNTTAMPGAITKITLACASGTTRTYTVYGNTTTAITSTSGGTSLGTIAPTAGNSASLSIAEASAYKYFWLNLAGGASILDSIVIEFEATVSVDSVSLNKTSTTLIAGNTEQLTETVLPVNATNKAVTWASDNTSVATVSSSGLITAVAAGSATITVTTDDGSKKATCDVTVNPNLTPTIALSKSSVTIDNGSDDSVVVTPSNFTSTPAVSASFTSTSSATGSYATASVSGMTVTITGTAVGNDTLTITATYGSETDSKTVDLIVNPIISGQWQKITSAAALTAGKYIITAPIAAGGTPYAMTNTNGTSSAPGAVALTWNGSVPAALSYNPVVPSGVNIMWDITVSGSAYTIRPSGASTYLYAISDNNGLRVGTTSDTWTLNYVDSYITMQEANNSRYVQSYATTPDFRSYNSIESGGQISNNADCFKMQFFKWQSTATLTSSLTVTGTLTNASQYIGRTLDITGLEITANYTGGGTMPIAHGDLNALPIIESETLSYQISYTEDSVTAYGTVTLTAALQDTLNSLSWTSRVTTYNEGDTFGGGTIKAIYTSGEVALTLEQVTIYVYSGSWNVETASIITSSTVLTNSDHNGLSIRLGYSGVYSTTSTLSVAFVPSTTYSVLGTTANLIKDISDLAAGDKIIIAYKSNDVALGAASGTGAFRTSVSVAYTGDNITTIGSATILTLGGSSGAWTLSDGTDYLFYDSSEGGNAINTGTVYETNENKWTISVSSAGVATITNVASNTRKLQYNNSNPRFACYATSQLVPGIYKLATTSVYNYNYLLDVLDGDYCSMDLAGLNLINSRYEAMTENEIAHFNLETIVGLDSNSYTGLEAYNAAMARRAILLSGSGFIASEHEINQSSSIAFILAISIVGISSIAFFFYRKKKELSN